MFDPIRLRLSALRALSTHVTPDLRAVCLKEVREGLIVIFFCDGKPSEELEDSAHVATTEISCDIPWRIEDTILGTNAEFVSLEYPKKMTLSGHLVYLRYEPDCDGYRTVEKKQVFRTVDSVHLRLSGMRALLGRVTSNLRGAGIYEEGPTVVLHFYYDGTISNLEQTLSQEALAEVMSDFQLNEKRLFEVRVEHIPSPQRILWQGNCLFARYEEP